MTRLISCLEWGIRGLIYASLYDHPEVSFLRKGEYVGFYSKRVVGTPFAEPKDLMSLFRDASKRSEGLPSVQYTDVHKMKLTVYGTLLKMVQIGKYIGKNLLF